MKYLQRFVSVSVVLLVTLGVVGLWLTGCGSPAQVSTVKDAKTKNAQTENSQTEKAETAKPETEKPETDEADQPKRTLSINDPLVPSEKETPLDDFVMPDEIAAKAFEPPPDAKSLSKSNLWVDRAKARVYVDGYVAMRDGPLEMFACPAGSKEHESVVAVLPRSQEVHAALLAVGAASGTPVRFRPRFLPPTGQRIRVWVCYRDERGKYQVVDGRDWVRRTGTEEAMETDWVFAGSSFWTDPSNGHEYYRADGGDMICVSNFSSAMMDVPFDSSAESNQLMYSPFTERIPPPGTPVRLVLVPIPIPSDIEKPEPKIDANQPPTEDVLKRKAQVSD